MVDHLFDRGTDSIFSACKTHIETVTDKQDVRRLLEKLCKKCVISRYHHKRLGIFGFFYRSGCMFLLHSFSLDCKIFSILYNRVLANKETVTLIQFFNEKLI